MNAPPNCPTQALWREFASASLARGPHQALDSHLETCAACQETLAALDGAAGLLSQVFAGLDERAAASSSLPDDDPDYRRLVARAKAIRPASAQSTVAPSQSSPAEGVLPAGTLLGAYVLAESIGAGGMGRVYKALHQRMRRTVAVKVLSARWLDSQEIRARFRREVESVARLSHPNVVAAFDAGEADGHHYLVMEYVPGRNLAEVVRDGGPLSVRVALDYVLQAARGLQHAHDLGIVHRDIKPGNLLLDDAGVVKVLDLGIAGVPWKARESDPHDLTAAQALLGTAAFMAPEQAANPRKVDHRADVYSLGCTLFYLLTGKNVHEGETAMEVVLAHREHPAPSLREHVAGCPAADCPAAVDRLFQRMVAKRPEDRPTTMQEVVAAIAELVQHPADNHAGEAPMQRNVALRTLPVPRITWAAAAALLVVVVAGLAIVGSAGKWPWTKGETSHSLISASDPGGTGDVGGNAAIEVTPAAGKAPTPSGGQPDTANKERGTRPIDRHVSFLDGIDPRRQALSGHWEWDGEALTSPTSDDTYADFGLPGKPPEEYVLTMTAERKSGADALRLGLVSGTRRFVVVFDLGADITSLGRLESFGPGEHATTVRNTVFGKDKPITVSCKVRTRDKRTQVDVFAEGERLVAWAGDTAALSPPADAPKDAALYVGTRKSSFCISRLELTPLLNGEPAPRWKTPPLTPKVEMVKLSAGKFSMGAAADDAEASADQKPQHEVHLRQGFLLGKFEVTRDEFAEVMDLARAETKDRGAEAKVGVSGKADKPSDQANDDPSRLPIVGVSWLTAVEFCNQLSLRHGLKPYYRVSGERVTIGGGDGFRLPTEAEWEYACRAGTDTKWHFGDDPRRLDEFEWHAGNSGGRPHAVGGRKPNPWGLHDMHGNAPEWCWDRYDPKYYKDSEAADPPGSPRGEQRVVRGGSASQRAAQTASASRTSLGTTYGTVDLKEPSSRPTSVPSGSRGVGIRVARSLE